MFLFLVLTLSLPLTMIPAADQSGALTPELLESFRRALVPDAPTRATINAVTSNNAKKLARNQELARQIDHHFNFKIKTSGITDQKQTGRCWMYAALNLLRPAVIKQYGIDKFEFSQNHLFFWDKLEKANLFLEAMIVTRKAKPDDREFLILLDDPVADGGWWNYVVELIEKYGVVPQDIMPETVNTENSNIMVTIINEYLLKSAAEIRRMAAEGKKAEELRQYKVGVLKQVYRLLVIHLGQPPQQFTWRFENKDHQIVTKTCTPLEFYRETVKVNLRDYLVLVDHPSHPYNEHYVIAYCRNLSNAADLDFVNLEIGRIKEFALKALLDSLPIWFAADVSHDMDRNGIMAPGIMDYEALYGIDLSLNKRDRFNYRISAPSHAMAIIGVDTVAGRPRQWLVENSWGANTGNQGYWTMLDPWFDSNIYAIIIPRQYLTNDVLQMFTRKPKELPVWDPMRRQF